MADSKQVIQQALDKLAMDSLAAKPAVVQPEIPASIAAPAQTPASIAAPATIAQPAIVEQPVPAVAVEPALVPGTRYPAPVVPPPPPPQSAYALPAEQQQQLGKQMGLVEEPILAPTDLEALSEPTEAQVLTAVEQFTLPERQAKAAQYALDEVDKMRAEADRRQQVRETATQAEIDKLDSQVREQSLSQILGSGTFGQKLGASLALLIGGLGQGYSGAKTNPFVDYMDKIAEQQAAADKLTADQKQMLKQQLYQQGTLELQKLENATQNAYRKDQIRVMRDELEAKQAAAQAKIYAELSQKAADANKYSGKALTPEQYASLKPEERRSVVTLLDGKRVMAANPTDAREYQKFATEVGAALNAVTKLQKLAADTPKWMLGKNPAEYKIRQNKADVLKQVIVGALRLPFTGPGVLTDTERAQLIATIGSPLDIFSLKSFELAKLGQVKDSLEANLQTTATSRGILEPVISQKYYNVNGRAIREDKLVEMYKQKMPGLGEDKIRKAIQSQLPSI